MKINLIFADPPYNLSGNGLHWKGNKTGGDWFMVNEEWDKMTAPEYLAIGARIHYKAQDHFRIAAASVSLFQAMMEALINYSLDSENALSQVQKAGFKNKWEKALKKLNQKTAHFNEYHYDIYIKYRIPLIHPETSKMPNIQDISFNKLHAGFKAGWNAFKSLYDGLGHPHVPKDSWKIMCKTYNIPGGI